MFKVPPASLQTFIDTPNCVLEDRVHYSTVHIPNVFCDGHHQVHTDVLITLYKYNYMLQLSLRKEMCLLKQLFSEL
jgi:hypothetical protein